MSNDDNPGLVFDDNDDIGDHEDDRPMFKGRGSFISGELKDVVAAMDVHLNPDFHKQINEAVAQAAASPELFYKYVLLSIIGQQRQLEELLITLEQCGILKLDNTPVSLDG